MKKATFHVITGLLAMSLPFGVRLHLPFGMPGDENRRGTFPRNRKTG
jgi:hypothetical protein